MPTVSELVDRLSKDYSYEVWFNHQLYKNARVETRRWWIRQAAAVIKYDPDTMSSESHQHVCRKVGNAAFDNCWNIYHALWWINGENNECPCGTCANRRVANGESHNETPPGSQEAEISTAYDNEELVQAFNDLLTSVRWRAEVRYM